MRSPLSAIDRDAIPYLIERVLKAPPERRETLATALFGFPTCRQCMPYLLERVLRAPPERRETLFAAIFGNGACPQCGGRRCRPPLARC